MLVQRGLHLLDSWWWVHFWTLMDGMDSPQLSIDVRREFLLCKPLHGKPDLRNFWGKVRRDFFLQSWIPLQPQWVVTAQKAQACSVPLGSDEVACFREVVSQVDDLVVTHGNGDNDVPWFLKDLDKQSRIWLK